MRISRRRSVCHLAHWSRTSGPDNFAGGSSSWSEAWERVYINDWFGYHHSHTNDLFGFYNGTCSADFYYNGIVGSNSAVAFNLYQT